MDANVVDQAVFSCVLSPFGTRAHHFSHTEPGAHGFLLHCTLPRMNLKPGALQWLTLPRSNHRKPSAESIKGFRKAGNGPKGVLLIPQRARGSL